MVIDKWVEEAVGLNYIEAENRLYQGRWSQDQFDAYASVHIHNNENLKLPRPVVDSAKPFQEALLRRLPGLARG